MSDEFLAVATKEVNADIEGIENILKSCSNDNDIFQNANKFQKHTYKIKGLVPMMGNENLGNFASTLDNVFKQMIEGKQHENIFDTLSESVVDIEILILYFH